MKFTISTARLNAILSRVAKGLGNNKIMPITQYLKVTLENGILSVTATDSNNFITCRSTGFEGDSGTAIVRGETLIKLSAKTTSEKVKIELKQDHLEFKGNGKYKIELFETNEFPCYSFDTSVEKTEIEVSKLKKMFAVNSSAIANEMLVPYLTGFNAGLMCITTDGIKMCVTATALFSSPVLISQPLSELINCLPTEKVFAQRQDNKILFTTESIVIFGTELDGIEDYPDVKPVLGIEYKNHVVVNKKQLVDTLDRMSLLVTEFDNYGVKLSFEEKCIVLTDLKNNGREEVEYVDTEQSGKEAVVVSIKHLAELLSKLTSPIVTMFYGAELPLKIREDKVVQILGRMEENE